MIGAGINGAVTWVDLSTPDPSGAVAFYRALLEWDDVEESETPLGRYHIGKVAGRDAGGMMAHGPEMTGAPAMWTVFIYAEDIDTSVRAAAQAGGTVLQEPFEIPGGARIAVIADPSGAMFGLFGGQEIEGEFYSRDPGRVCWTELLTRDPPAAGDFYVELFGWTAQTDESTDPPYTVFTLGDEMVAGMMPMPDAVPAEAPSHWSVHFAVADCERSQRRAVELGGQVLVPTMTIAPGRFAVLEDPQGAPFDVMEFRDESPE